MLTFLQLSDIHFRDAPGEYDYLLRDRLIADARAQAELLGGVSAVLVSGDVAQGGGRSEFGQASEWLRRLCADVDVPPWMVWTIPGNHDIHRQSICAAAQGCRDQIRGAGDGAHSAEFDSAVRDESLGVRLVNPFAAYLEFAEQFSCGFSRDRIMWDHRVPWPGPELRLLGLNSALLCGSGDNQTDKRMVIGEAQHSTLSLACQPLLYVMCHHPDNWLFDPVQEIVEPHIRVTGHEHQRAISRSSGSFYLQAGAVSPPRESGSQAYAEGCEPTYDLITLRFDSTDDGACVRIEAVGRRWNDRLQQWEAEAPQSHSLALSGTSVEREWIAASRAARLEAPDRALRYDLANLAEHDREALAAEVGAPLGLLMDGPSHEFGASLLAWAEVADARLEALRSALDSVRSGRLSEFTDEFTDRDPQA